MQGYLITVTDRTRQTTRQQTLSCDSGRIQRRNTALRIARGLDSPDVTEMLVDYAQQTRKIISEYSLKTV